MKRTFSTVVLLLAIASASVPGLAEACEFCELEGPLPDVESEVDRGGTIFFATTLGLGIAFPSDVQFDPGPTPGAVWEVTFGWGFTRHWAFGIDFGTWQTSFLGLPFHFHNAFAPRLELTPGGEDGFVVSLAAGLGTTDGVRPPNKTHHGVAITPRLAYRWDLGSGVALSAVSGLHVHTYVDASNTPLVPFLVAELRFYGDTDGD